MRIAIVGLAILLLISCTTTQKPAPKDPFFELPVTVTTSRLAKPTDTSLPAVSSSETGSGQILLEFTLHSGTEKIQAPSIVVDGGDDAEVRIMNEIAFVQDFDLEVAEDAFIADPIIGTLIEGLRIEVSPTRRQDGWIDLSFRIACSDIEAPIRTKNALAGHGPNAMVTIQLPAVNLAEVAGKALLAPGVETSLASFPAYSGGEVKQVQIMVRAFPLGDSERSSATVVKAPQALSLQLVRLADTAPEEVRHLDGEAGARLLARSDTEVLKCFVLRTSADPSIEVRALRQVSYHRDYDVSVERLGAALLDPEIDTLTEGFSGTVKLENGSLVLLWTFDRLLKMPTFSTSLESGGPVVTIDLPELLKLSGDLPLIAPVNVVGIARLADGGTLAAVVVLP